MPKLDHIHGIERIKRPPSSLSASFRPRSANTSLYILERKLERYQKELQLTLRRKAQVEEQIQLLQAEMDALKASLDEEAPQEAPARTRAKVQKWKTRVLKY